jgi:FkbM family methyltransferase
MTALPHFRDFLFRCRHGFRGVPRTLNGVVFRLDESLRRWAFESESKFHSVIQKHLRPGDVVFDVGANFGMHVLHAARLVGPSGRVYAFEPVPANLRLLRRHLQLNQLEGTVKVVATAVSNSPEPTLEMFLPADRIAVAASLRPTSGHAQVTRVPNLRLDDLRVPDESRLRLMKVDVEGAELDVIRGACGLLQRTRPLLLIEVHGFALPDFGASVELLRECLASLDYVETILEESQVGGSQYCQSLFWNRCSVR